MEYKMKKTNKKVKKTPVEKSEKLKAVLKDLREHLPWGGSKLRWS